MLVSHERGGSNGYPQSMTLYKTSKHRLREHFKTPRRSSRNRCFSIEMKSIRVDLLSTPVSLQYKSRGGGMGVGGGDGGRGGGSKLHGYFCISRLHSFIFCLFLYCTRTFTFFHYLLVPSLLKSVFKIQVTNPAPGLLIIFSGGGGITCISNIDYV